MSKFLLILDISLINWSTLLSITLFLSWDAICFLTDALAFLLILSTSSYLRFLARSIFAFLARSLFWLFSKIFSRLELKVFRLFSRSWTVLWSNSWILFLASFAVRLELIFKIELFAFDRRGDFHHENKGIFFKFLTLHPCSIDNAFQVLCSFRFCLLKLFVELGKFLIGLCV